ncbi:DUF418 domain-containing protein [Corynebacterium sp. NPDC060344]|uniref:DUF418 domain-containing protein n=1 Tax=Corynebacterium sp. NPDC060344 TaxID=3347101 RepID=UPI00365CFB15
MLLSIGVANAVTSWTFYSSSPAATAPGAANAVTAPDRSVADTVLVVLNEIFVHVRGLPMFALLFGYGIGMLVTRESRRGVEPKTYRGLLLRRYGWLVLFGAVHCIFLFSGDILMLYALLGLIAVFLLRLSNRTLLWVAGVLAVVGAVIIAMEGGDADAAAMFPGAASGATGGTDMSEGGYLTKQLGIGLISAITVPASIFDVGPQLGALILLGIVAARAGILEDPVRHRRLLAIVAAVGLTAAVATGIPAGLAKIGVLDGAHWGSASSIAGTLAGPGIICAIALICLPLQRRIRAAAEAGRTLSPPEPFLSLQALGQRSMSGYVGQSVLFQIVAAAWFLDLFDDASLTIIVAWACAVWLVTLIAARALHAAGRPGPLESLHRRLTYGAGDTRRN